LPTTITVQAFVHDPDGGPVEGATVYLGLPRYGLDKKNEEVSAVTNKDGAVTLTGIAESDYDTLVQKPGYYRTNGPPHSIDSETGFKKYAVGIQKIDFELRPIRNPTHSIGKFADRLRIPAMNTPVGFDLESGDWVTPYGKGKSSDLIFKLTGFYNGLNDYDQTLLLAFSNPGDGLILTTITPRIGSDFKLPYEAPLDGYESQREWKKSFDGKTRKSTEDLHETTNFIFRVRTHLDGQGNVLRALYGAIMSEISLGGNKETGHNVSFVYQLNPDWTRNLEFDPEKEVAAGTGKLAVSPAPGQ
jgi:hypothetical protein